MAILLCPSLVSILLAITSLILIRIHRLQMTPTKLEKRHACCLEGGHNPVIQFQMISSLNDQLDGNRDHVMHDTPASAHLQLRGPHMDEKSSAYGGPSDSSRRGPSFASTCLIHDKPEDRTNEEHARGVDVSQDGSTIKYRDLYYVYCSLGFTYTSDVSLTPLLQYVERFRPKSPWDDGVLLKSSHSRQHDDLSNPIRQHTGGVFWLDKGDELHVVFKAQGEINIDSSFSSLGLFMLSSGDPPD